jgi:cell wall assembly regulator SMI1
MKTIWDRIHVWLAANAPKVQKSLCRGASERAIRAAEREMGVTFPDDVKACYRIHDGQREGGADFLYGWHWNSLDGMLEDWRLLKGMSENVEGSRGSDDVTQTDWWHPAWLPILTNYNGDFRCLDLAPGPAGSVGQILFWWHDDSRWGEGRRLQAHGFTLWLDDFVGELEEGEWLYSEEFGGLAHLDNFDLEDEE